MAQYTIAADALTHITVNAFVRMMTVHTYVTHVTVGSIVISRHRISVMIRVDAQVMLRLNLLTCRQ
eukprot:7073580-Karenia_brevis.AAC.1